VAIFCSWIHFYLERCFIVKITRQAFTELFGEHVPGWSPSAWVRGIRYVFVVGTDEIEERELLLGAVTNEKA